MASNYESNINLVHMPQLVMDKIVSFLNHKQLLALEQVSTNFKCAVNEHFAVTNHLVVGSLPEAANYKKKLNGFLKVIKRCGPNLRTIQITGQIRDQTCENYIEYFRYLFGSVEIADKCPNIENIITFAKMDLDFKIYNKGNIALNLSDIGVYARNIKLSTGRPCKFRTMLLDDNFLEDEFSLYSNVEQIIVPTMRNFCPLLPQFIKNGLKDLEIYFSINLEEAKKLLNIGRNLRTLTFTLRVESDDDVILLNRLPIHKNAKINLYASVDCITLLKRNICNSIIKCDTELPLKSYTSMDKLKNLEEVHIRNVDQIDVILERSFQKLKIIRIGEEATWGRRVLDLTFLPALLINKGNQLTVIDIQHECDYSLDTIWRSLKYCTAAEIIKFREVVIDSPSSLTEKDVKVVCNLPKLQHLILIIREKPDQNSGILCELIRRAAEDTDFKFEYQKDAEFISKFPPFYEQRFTLDRINL